MLVDDEIFNVPYFTVSGLNVVAFTAFVLRKCESDDFAAAVMERASIGMVAAGKSAG
ncbi:MAG: hypothetical protein M3Y27_05140 [Acidobacteriota bacterium]|nr:hypothetical protein [Acidobacteriota bacterium]